MPDPVEHMYCAEQINIPVNFPYILKLYAKAAIRTQPYDLLKWTSAYFRALADGKTPPVKERLEYPPYQHPSRITPGYLKALLNQYGHVERVTLESILTSWHEIGFSEASLYQISTIGQFLKEQDCDFYQFLALACGLLGNNLFETMVFVCELLTDEPEGGSGMIPLKTFLSLYGYLANLNCSGEPEVSDVCFCESASEIAEEEEDEFQEKEQVEEEEVKKRTSKETVSDLPLCYADQIGEETELYSQAADVDELSQEVVKDEVIQVSREEVDLEQVPQPIESQVESQTADANSPAVERVLKDERIHSEKEEPEDERKHPQIETIFDQSDQSPGIKPINDEQYPLMMSETPRDSFEIVDELKMADEEEKGVKEAEDEKEEDDYSYSFKEEEATETSSYDEYIEHEPLGLEKLLEGTCECPASRRESEQQEEVKSPMNPLEEFVSRMKVQFPNPCELFKVPGIGPKVSEDKVTAVGLWLAECARRQNGVVGPRNMRHFLCPTLDDHPTYEDYTRTKLKCP